MNTLPLNLEFSNNTPLPGKAPVLSASATFGIGDQVRVAPYLSTRFKGESRLSWASGLVGYVVETLPGISGPSGVEECRVRLRVYLEEIADSGEFEHATEYTENVSHLQLLKKGTGSLRVGVDCPYSRAELRELYATQLLEGLESRVGKRASFNTMASELIAQNLRQDAWARAQLQSIENSCTQASSCDAGTVQFETTASDGNLETSGQRLSRYQGLQEAVRAQSLLDASASADDFSHV